MESDVVGRSTASADQDPESSLKIYREVASTI